MEACKLVLENKEIVYVGGLVLTLAIEAWLGKTDRVASGSILELLLNLLKGRAKQQPITEEKKDDQAL